MRRGIVVIGGSSADCEALASLLGSLPLGFPLPVVAALNGDAAERPEPRPPAIRTLLPVHEAEDKDLILPGQIHFGPADYHLLIEAGSLALSTEAPVGRLRPSIEVLFDSAAEAFGPRAIAIALSHSGDDGARGLGRIVERGGLALAQLGPAAGGAPPAGRALPLADIAMILCSLCA
jgi:two-component system, chemotaxis family, protein-glutamate methylesterase/glutaminase